MADLEAVTKQYIDEVLLPDLNSQITTTLGILQDRTTPEYHDFTTIGDSGSSLEIQARVATINGEQIATLQDLDNRRFRYLGYEKCEHGIITRERKLQQRVIKVDARTMEPVEVWEDIPTVEE
jgi:hypothetical protein